MLAGTISIAGCKKILETLDEKNLIQCKHYSSPIYLINQSLLPEINQDIEKEIESQLEISNTRLNENKSNNKNLKNELKNIKQIKTEEEILNELVELSKEIEKANEKLQGFKTIEKVDEAVMLELQKAYDVNYKKTKTLKKIYSDILDFFLEKMDITRVELLEELKIDKDEEIDLLNKLKYNL